MQIDFARLVARTGAVMAFALAGCFSDGIDERCQPMGPDGVRLNRIPGTSAISIPAGLSNERALDAVEQAISGTHPGTRSNSWVSQWRPELRDPSNQWIRVGLSVRQHYLCVCYRVEGGSLVPDVPTSRNLNQDGVSIHRKVPAWINRFNSLVSQQLYANAEGTACAGVKESTKERKLVAEARVAEANALKAEAEAAQAAQGTNKTVTRRFCESCGAQVGAEAAFCSSCGKRLKK